VSLGAVKRHQRSRRRSGEPGKSVKSNDDIGGAAITLDEQFDRIEVRLNALKWMVGANIAASLLVLGVLLWLSTRG
jgi:hypothetical protein